MKGCDSSKVLGGLKCGIGGTQDNIVGIGGVVIQVGTTCKGQQICVSIVAVGLKLP